MKKRIRSLMLVLLTVVIIIWVIVIAPIATSAAEEEGEIISASCVKTQAEAVAWLNAQEGVRYDLDGAYGSQCSDFSSAYVNYVLTGNPYGGRIGVYNAKEYSNVNLYPNDWQVFANTASFVPQPGDIFVVTGADSRYGHTGVVISSNVNNATVADQNGLSDWSLDYGSPAHIHNITWSGSFTPKYFIRPSFGPAGNNPEGVVDIIEGREGKVVVRGWAFDRDNFGSQISVHVYIGGKSGDANAEGHAITANTQRTDVNAHYGCGDWHGFSAEISTSKRGSQPVYVYAINVGAGNTNPMIGSGTVNILDYNAPQLENVMVTKVSKTGYRVVGKLSSQFGIASVQLPTWTENNGQDDLIWHSAVVSGNYFSYYIKASDHNNEQNRYITHIYATDNIGQQNSFRAPVANLTDEVIELDSMVYQGSKYALYNHDFSWQQAKEWCESKGGHLVTISNENEWNAIQELLSRNNGMPVWLGAENTSGTWKWVTGENMEYSDWENNQPDNSGNVEYYLGTHNGDYFLDCYKWNDYENNATRIGGFICEFDNENIIGELNGDNSVDVLDATIVQKHAVGKADLINEQLAAADVNNDNNVDILDAAEIQKFAAGKITEFKKKP